jgi:hypothetical protein
MSVVPSATLVAMPRVPVRLLIEATAGTEDVQFTEVVKSAVRPPVKVPVAVNCSVSPSVSDGLTGVTAIEVRPVVFPVPVRLTVAGLPNALWLMDSAPVRVPVAVGVNVTPIVQVAAGARAPHVFERTAKSPVIVAPEMVTDEVSWFVTVTVTGALVVPTERDPKLYVVGVALTARMPAPDNPTDCGLFAASSVNFSVPVRVPRAVGTNAKPTTQFAPAPIVTPQVLLLIRKSPVATMLPKVSGTFFLLVSVTDLVALVPPTPIFPKLRVLADNVTGAIPEPVRFTVSGLLLALWETVSVPGDAPTREGANATRIVQFRPPASTPVVVGHVPPVRT